MTPGEDRTAVLERIHHVAGVHALARWAVGVGAALDQGTRHGVAVVAGEVVPGV